MPFSALERKLRRGLGAGTLVVAAVTAGCAGVAPVLTSLAVNFAQDLIAAAAANHAPRYAVQVEQLLVALATQATGMQLQAQLAATGYQAPPPDYLEGDASGYSYSGSPGVSNNPYLQATVPYAPDGGSYGQTGLSPAGAGSGGGTSPEYGSAYTVQEVEGTSYGQDDPYGPSTRDATIIPITLEADILARRRGSASLQEIEDGDTLKDGGSHPAQGDLLKLQFLANCACYVYIVGVDATGYVARIYPDPEEGHSNPVIPGTRYLIPAGREDWWAMDSFTGVEQVFFVASYVPRPDIENVLDELGGAERNVDPDSYRPVNVAAVVPATRGLVKVKADPVPVAGGAATITPSVFTSAEPGNELVITRWFNHR